jgi:hypothetical protein
MECYYLSAMQNGKYLQAKEILEDTINDANLKNMTETDREKWLIFEAYFMCATGAQDINYKNDHELRIGKLMNEIPVFSRDLRGLNVAVLLLQSCLLIRAGNFTKQTSISEALKLYRLRHLVGKPDYRAYLFVKMLQAAERLGYDYEAVKRATNTNFEKLKAAPIKYSANMEGLEVVPLDDLWQSALGDMKRHGALLPQPELATV